MADGWRIEGGFHSLRGACIPDIYPLFDLSVVLFSGLSITLFCISVFSVMLFQAINGVVWYVLNRDVVNVCFGSVLNNKKETKHLAPSLDKIYENICF